MSYDKLHWRHIFDEDHPVWKALDEGGYAVDNRRILDALDKAGYQIVKCGDSSFARTFTFEEVHALHTGLWEAPPVMPSTADVRTLCRMAKDCIELLKDSRP